MSNNFPDPHEKVDKLIAKKKNIAGGQLEHSQMQKAYSNIVFRNEVKEAPITTDKYRKKIFGVEYINLQPYLNMRMWPRGIYTTDKLLRLDASAGMEFLKRYLAKKRTVPFKMLWLLIIMFGVVAAIITILFLLPQLGDIIPI